MKNLIRKTLVLGFMQTNCYLVTNPDTLETIIIDPADEADRIIQAVEKKNLRPIAILLTHGHHDHITGCSDIRDKYQIKIYCHQEEERVCTSKRQNLSYKMGRVDTEIKPDILFQDDEEVELAGYPIKVMHTPGHTIGSVCYYFHTQDVLFSGDMLFRESVGRTDFETGDFQAILESLRNKLMGLPDQVEVFPGHGMPTSIGYERKNNPYVTQDAFWE